MKARPGLGTIAPEYGMPIESHDANPHGAKRATNVAEKATLPTEAKSRKAIPLYSGLVRYFPRALIAVAECSQVGNDQHNPGQPLRWDRSKSSDEHDALLRHLWEAGTVDVDGVRHSTKLAWRALAALEKELERVGG